MKTMTTFAAIIGLGLGFASPAFAEKPDPAPVAPTAPTARPAKPDPKPVDKRAAFTACLKRAGLTEVATLREWEGEGKQFEPGFFYIGSRPFISADTPEEGPDGCAAQLGMPRHK